MGSDQRTAIVIISGEQRNPSEARPQRGSSPDAACLLHAVYRTHQSLSR
jgi:hypothetical protein